MSIRITVITVCFNAGDTIERTIRSVIMQTEKPFEYLIVDGDSQDDTVDKAERMTVGLPWVKIISGTDLGLYDAMNKGVTKSNGDFIVFLNSGDIFADNGIVRDVRSFIGDRDSIDLVYSDVIRDYGDLQKEEIYGGWLRTFILILSGRMPCHQGIFTSRELLDKYPFDLRYSITADYNFFMKCMKYRENLHHMKRVTIISESVSGISSREQNLDEMRKQDDQSMKELYPLLYEMMRPIKYLKREIQRHR